MSFLLGSKTKHINLLRQFSDIGISLLSEKNTHTLLKTLLEGVCKVSGAEVGILYLLKNDHILQFKMIRSKLDKLNFCAMPNSNLQNKDNDKISPLKYVVDTKLPLNISNIHNNKIYDFSYLKELEEEYGYKSKSLLIVPLKTAKQEILGVINLVNAKGTYRKVAPFNKSIQNVIESLASQAAIAADNQQLLREQEKLIDGIVRMIALAIDETSAHTSKHCQAIPVLVDMIASSACAKNTGYFANFHLSDNDIYALNIASWLHDCGKLSTPLYILDKATKLETVLDRIDLIKARFEIIERDLEIDMLRKKISKQEYIESREKIKKDFEFIRKLNIGSEFVSDNKISRLNSIFNTTWLPRINNKKEIRERIFTDDEYENLSIRKGTLTKKEREIINNHMNVTVKMLESLPLPKNLKNVPEYACGHHEKMDGSGFPKGLKRDQMSIPARIMAVADIFEALTSRERPYKKPNKLSEALAIMSNMSRNGHIDPDIFELFVNEKIYLKYAKKFLLPEQIDDVEHVLSKAS